MSGELDSVYVVERGEWSNKYGRYVYPAFRDRSTHDDLMAGLINRWHAVHFVRADNPLFKAAPTMLAALREAGKLIQGELEAYTDARECHLYKAREYESCLATIDAAINQATGGGAS